MGFNNTHRQEEIGANKNVATTTGGRNNARKIHIAHRKSPCELTNLMIEQFNLTRQLDIGQQQHSPVQKHHNISQLSENHAYGATVAPVGATSFLQPPQPQFNNSPAPNTSNKSRSHSRNNSGFYSGNNDFGGSSSHRRTGSQSSVYGHTRRHSLGLNEAKKAAAEEQAKRAVSILSSTPTKLEHSPDGEESSANISAFKFPPPAPVPPQAGHRRANSAMSPNRSFQFPATSSGKENQDDSPAVDHSHRRTSSRGQDLPGINSNWRVQQTHQQQSSSYHKTSYSNQGFGLDPSPVFQPGHRSRGSNASTHSFNSSPGANNANGRKSLFAPYLPQANIPQLIEEGRLVAGVLRVNKKNRSDAWVSTDGVLDADIFICGSKDRNRALEGDIVAVELLMVDDVWESKKEKEEKKRRKDASTQQDVVSLDSKDDYHNDASLGSSSVNTSGSTQQQNASASKSGENSNGTGSIKRRGSLKQRPTQKKNDDVEVEGQSLLLVEEEVISDEFKPLYAGHVVAVLDRIPGQLFSGTLGLLRPSQQSCDSDKPQKPKIVWFKPTDKKVPLIAIPIEQAPKDFVENSENYTNKTFVASIKRWPITSLHPFGTLVSQLGEINDPATEIDSILRDNNFLLDEYPEHGDYTKDKELYSPKVLSAEELAERKVYDETVAISEDGILSNLALHVETLPDGNIELGCHVVDVTAHIEEGSSLDRRARKRSTAVFMPQRSVQLLPDSVNKHLNLEAGRQTATLSVIYKIHPKTYEVISYEINESLVEPKALLTFEQLNREFDREPDKITEFAKLLYSISTQFFRQRFQLTDEDISSNSKLSLLSTLDDEKVKVNLNLFETSLAASIIGEIEHKVNNTVAEKIYVNLGPAAFLRRQSPPVSTKLQLFKKKVQRFNTYPVHSLLQSIISMEDAKTKTCVELLLYKALNRARYFVAAKVEPDQFGHFSLNMHLYTHFTAPLRRYADHVVHRQLKSVIHGTEYKEDLESLKITSEYCNFKKDCASHAQQQAIHLLLSKTINDMGNAGGQLLVVANVLQVYESSFDVFIPEFGIEKRIHGDQLPLIKAEYDGSSRVLELYWQRGIDSATFVPPDEKNPKSYRTSIKNKFRSTSKEIALMQKTAKETESGLIGDELASEFSKLHIEAPRLHILTSDEASDDPLAPYLDLAITRQEGDNYIQEIHELSQVPVLLRAEIGMALPCLTIRALNPFTTNY
ncbi:HBR306Cp [Eremothecium sinecaudum]|uniref:HBR306Cp n=1 Tax=Eremothecium sinecaudum TaxID=45286 RepID=A0A109UY01_9SACH|nr:HBR306Cp [Eremothecium sinecaudum]AMD19207.1 HBR306Cp [Eremothecium sinecaudum]